MSLATRAAGACGLFLAVLLATACGDAVADAGGDPIPVPRSDAMAALPQDLPTFCPKERPRVNTFCQVEGSTCEYGTSADMQCNRTFACVPETTGNLWIERTSERCHKAVCPTEPADIESLDNKPCSIDPPDGGATTDADEAVCTMTNGICACTTGADGAHAHERRWVCIRPGVGGCPLERPRAGDACSGSFWCDYGSCKWKRGLLMQCEGAHWMTGGAPCN